MTLKSYRPSSCQSRYKLRTEHNHYPVSSPQYCLVNVRAHCPRCSIHRESSSPAEGHLVISGQQWDDYLPEAMVTQLMDWSNELPLLSKIEIPRTYLQETVERLGIHVLSDSFQDVFIAVASLRG